METAVTVNLTLHDGETLTIARQDVPRVCENLWRLAPDPEAIVMAGVVVAATRDFSDRFPLELSASQSAVLCKALARPEAA
jgi:hypothetical protein